MIVRGLRKYFIWLWAIGLGHGYEYNKAMVLMSVGGVLECCGAG